MYILSTVKTENTYTPARLKKLFKSSQLTPFLSRHHLWHFVPPKIRSPSFFASDCVRNPSRCFVKRSAVLIFVSTRLTDRRFSRIHCCISRHRISISLSPPGPLRCRMCLAESESITRRTENVVLQFLEEFGKSQKFSCASTGCVEVRFACTETDRCLFQTSVALCHVLYIAMISPVTL